METVHVYPMHGYHKWIAEGYRTRDAHLTEWMSRLLADKFEIRVTSRPEPYPLRKLHLRKAPSGASTLPGTVDNSRDVVAFPSPRNPKRWWVDSVKYFADLPAHEPVVVWNPMVALHSSLPQVKGHLHFDILDNWLAHQAFRKIRSEVERAYARMFDAANSITANSEATLELAQRFGRHDALLLPNGCDPQKFNQDSRASGRFTVGYVGKIGRRLDTSLILQTAADNPDWRFVFAGPVLEREIGKALHDAPNIEMIGDVFYERVPDLLTTFDVGWVPHDVANGQVGGDAIKIYEYRAAALPVVTTPIIGTRERPLDHVHVETDHSSALRSLEDANGRGRREPAPLPEDIQWQTKARLVLRTMGLL